MNHSPSSLASVATRSSRVGASSPGKESASGGASEEVRLLAPARASGKGTAGNGASSIFTTHSIVGLLAVVVVIASLVVPSAEPEMVSAALEWVVVAWLISRFDVPSADVCSRGPEVARVRVKGWDGLAGSWLRDPRKGSQRLSQRRIGR